MRLAEVADINPRVIKYPGADEIISFLGMANVDAVDGTTSMGVERPYGEVSKGYTNFQSGDLLVAKITPCFENGKIAQARLSRKIGVGSTEFHVIRPHGARLDPRYALHFLRQPRIRREGERRMTGSAGQRRVPEAFLADLRISVPSIETQQRIADILDRADALCAKRRKALALLDGLIQSIFLDMFGNDLGDELLLNVIADESAITYGIVQAGDEFLGGVPYIRTGDLVDGEVDLGSLRHTDPVIAARFSRSRVRAGDIVISIRATVGTTALIPAELEGANLTQGTAKIAPGRDVEPEYLLEYLRSSQVQAWIERQVKGATFREITLARLRELPVLVPARERQRLFVDFWRRTKIQRDVLLRLDRATREIYESLQQRAFAGQL